MSAPKNCWYVATFSSDLSQGNILSRTVCGEPMVLYRTSNGTVVALEDRCIHRGMPFSHGGVLRGDAIQCPYHGMVFGPSGKCVSIPGQEEIPSSAAVRNFAVTESSGAIWVWPGKASSADYTMVPGFPYSELPGWKSVSFMLEIEANWMLVVENLLDLTHIGFIHDFINGEAGAHAEAVMKVVKDGERGVSVLRYLPNTQVPGMYLLGRDPGLVDRWMDIHFVPGLIDIWGGCVEPLEYGDRETKGIQTRGFHGITPRTATSCYYHFKAARNFQLDDGNVDCQILAGAKRTLLQDKDVIEAQQRRLQDTTGRPFFDRIADRGQVHARLIVKRMIKAESSHDARSVTAA